MRTRHPPRSGSAAGLNEPSMRRSLSSLDYTLIGRLARGLPRGRARVLIRDRMVECGVHTVSIHEMATNIHRVPNAPGFVWRGRGRADVRADVSARGRAWADALRATWQYCRYCLAVLPPARAPGTGSRSLSSVSGPKGARVTVRSTRCPVARCSGNVVRIPAGEAARSALVALRAQEADRRWPCTYDRVARRGLRQRSHAIRIGT
jgi:hypothetical protein